MSSVLGALKALTELFLLLKEVVGLYQQARREGWLEEGRALARAIKEAKTDEARRKLVRRLALHRIK